MNPNVNFVFLSDFSTLDLLSLENISWESWRPPQGHYYQDHYLSPIQGATMGYMTSRKVPSKSRPPLSAELTSWPRNSFNISWNTFLKQAVLSSFLGFQKGIFWAGTGYRDPHFSKQLSPYRDFLDTIFNETLEHPELVGLPVLYSKDQLPYPSEGMTTLSRMGIATYPLYESELGDQRIIALSSTQKIEKPEILSERKLFIDTTSINYLGRDLKAKLSLQNSEKMFSCEYLKDDFSGKYSSTRSCSLTESKECDMQTIIGVDAEQVYSEYWDSHDKTITPALFTAANNQYLISNTSEYLWSRLLSMRKSDLVRRALLNFSNDAEPVSIIGTVNIFAFARENNSSRVVLLINTSNDSSYEWSLKMNKKFKSSYFLNKNGQWESIKSKNNPSIQPQEEFPANTFRVYKFEI